MGAAAALVPLWERATEWQRRLAMVREARQFLYTSTFYIEYDEYAEEFLAALLDAQRRGVAVNLLVDAFGQRLGGVLMSSTQRAALERDLGELRAAGGVVTFYRPPRFVQRRVGGGQHVKIQVSDSGEAIFGSSNITRSSFAGWNEYAVAVRGPVAATLLESYRGLGGSVAQQHIDVVLGGHRHVPAQIAVDYWFCNPNPAQGLLGPFGWNGPNLVTDHLVEMIDAARHQVLITSFYFKPVAPLMDAVLRAARRGVLVEVHHSHRDALPATDLAWIAAAVSYPRLLDAGVAIFENRHGEHSKLVAVDGARVAFGSYNFEDAAHDRLAEAMLVSSDAVAVEPVMRIFGQLRAHPDNVRVTQASMEAWPPRQRRRIACFGRFKRWM